MKKEELAGMFDHTLLKPYATDQEFEKFCNEAKEMIVKMVAINSVPIKLCKKLLKGSPIHVGAAIDRKSTRLNSSHP